MRFLTKLLVALTLCGAALTGSAAEPRNGAEYHTLPVAQPTDTGKKVEVIEFFAYYCPHCNVFEPALAAWVRKQGDNIVFKRVHVPRDPSVAPQQRLFYTLEALGLLEQYHDKVFHAMHAERQRLNSDELVFDFIAKQGIDRNKFIEAYRSFGVEAKVRRAAAMMEAYRVDSWPMVAIDGRFITSPALADQGRSAKNEAELHAQVLAVMDYLVAQAKAEKK